MTSESALDVVDPPNQSDILAHVRHLSEKIGPRGSTTEAEEEAANYVSAQLTDLGLTTTKERFDSAYSAYAPYAIATGVLLICLFLYWQPQWAVDSVAALFIGGVFFAALLMEMRFKDNLLRWVQSRGDSVNVSTHIMAVQTEATGAPIVITAHLDTHRTPLLFSSKQFLTLFKGLLPATLLSMGVLLLLFLVGIFSDARWLRMLALVPGAVILLAFGLMVQADFTPFTKGANDNASGVAVALALAQRLHEQPLQRHAVHLVFTGAEEVAGYGANAFFAQHRDELKNAIHLVIDQVGDKQSDPCVVRSERFLVKAPSDPKLVAIAEQVILDQPELKAHMRDLNLAYSELSVGARYGLRTIGLGALPRNGLPVDTWHRPTDTVDQISEDVLTRCESLAWHLLQGIDHQDA